MRSGSNDHTARFEPETPRRLAGAPISWGVCEVPGWGRTLSRDRVLTEMASVGLRATELGPLGYLPLEPGPLRELLAAHELRLVAGFVPLVLHERSIQGARQTAEWVAALLAAAGAETFLAAAVMDEEWSAPQSLGPDQWRRLVEHLAVVGAVVADHGLELALHPHQGTLIETAGQVERLLASSDTAWCLDSGHLLIGGVDPADFVRDHGDRVAHVHLKDVDAALAARVRSGGLSLVEATKHGLFRPLGRGDSGIEEVVQLLDERGYERWLVLEQDTAITGEEPPVGSGPMLDVKESIAYLDNLAPNRRRVA